MRTHLGKLPVVRHLLLLSGDSLGDLLGNPRSALRGVMAAMADITTLGAGQALEELDTTTEEERERQEARALRTGASCGSFVRECAPAVRAGALAKADPRPAAAGCAHLGMGVSHGRRACVSQCRGPAAAACARFRTGISRTRGMCAGSAGGRPLLRRRLPRVCARSGCGSRAICQQ